ncbi:MAG: hypothetical protein A2Y95_01135 [Deltaproteobacteria bacterium RBG_13_65_10]|nr:MAG: hypothetical protein A2Y95_01135 [Deltaproteobacteria bacterium RBG_13_65_10]
MASASVDFSKDRELTSYTREFSFRFVTAAIVAFVLLYIFTLKGTEALVRARVSQTLRAAVIADPEQLLSGRIRYDEFVNQRAHEVLARLWIRTATRLGLDLVVRVATTQGEILYPRLREWFPSELPVSQQTPLAPSTGVVSDLSSADRNTIARSNYRLMREGIVLDVRANINNNTWLANGFLLVYLLALLQVLWIQARRFVVRTEEEKLALAERLQREKAQRVGQIETELSRVRSRLSDVSRHEGEQMSRIEALEREKRQLEERLGGWSWEDAGELEMEVERLESQLRETQEEKTRQEEMIRELSKRIQQRRTPNVPRGKAREAELLDRRLHTLYKNLDFDQRVTADLISLGDDEALLRAEEAIKRLNDRDENLPIRRKVGGLERANVFELGFGAKGRIYYTHSHTEGGRMRIVLVGAKNTQEKDLAYLRRYRGPA